MSSGTSGGVAAELGGGYCTRPMLPSPSGRATASVPSRRALRAAALAPLLALAAAPGPGLASDEPGFDALAARLRTREARFVLLVQSVADLQGERRYFGGHNGFSMAAVRPGVAGELDRGVSYAVKAELVRQPAILDARLSQAVGEAVTFDIGRFKVPFSKELLTGAGSIDFVNRAQAISALAPGRQAGLQARARLAGRRLHAAAGVWNGTASAAGNDDEGFLYAGRLTARPFADSTSDGALELGVSAGIARDHALALLGGAIPSFSGERRLGGADVRWTGGPWLLAAEAIGAHLDPDGGGRFEPWGFHSTAGYRFHPRAQAVARFERFQRAGFAPDLDLVVLGLNLTSSRLLSCQANFIVPTATGPEHHQFLLNVQFEF